MVRFRKVFLTLLVLSYSIAPNVSYAQEQEIVFAISPKTSPVSTLSNYNDFMKYLSKKIGYTVVIKQRRKNSEINSLLETGEAQFALSCTGAFLSGQESFGLKVLAVPVMYGTTTYNSYVIVNKESGIEDFRQLKGKVFALIDPLSLSGRLYPLNLLKNMGLKPNEFFKKTFYTSSHDKSIESVAHGLADGAAVGSHIYNDLEAKGAPYIDRVRIVKVSPPYGMPPVVVSPLADRIPMERISRALLKMAEDPEGKVILDRMKVDKFVKPDWSIYTTAVQLRHSNLLP